MWFFVLQTDHRTTAYAFGALVSSFVHFFLYLHFFLRSLKVKVSPCARTLLGYLQLAQCVLCFGHAIWALVFETNIPSKLSVLQLLYVCNAFILYYRDLVIGAKEKFGRTAGCNSIGPGEIIGGATEGVLEEGEELRAGSPPRGDTSASEEAEDHAESPSARGFSSGALKAASSPTKRRKRSKCSGSWEHSPSVLGEEGRGKTNIEGGTTSMGAPGRVWSASELVKKHFAPLLHTRIGDAVYDLTQFQTRHPGGNVISQYHNVDATDAYEAFHGDSEWARKTLKTLPKLEPKLLDGSGTSGTTAVVPNPENMSAFHEDLKRRYYRRPQDRAFFALWAAGTLGLIAFSLWLCAVGWVVLGGLFVGVAWAHCGFLQHHAGHVAVTGRRSLDFLIQTFFEGLIKGG